MTHSAVVEKKDEKLEKRKALGRGLASLLPGPRAVPSPDNVSVPKAAPAVAETASAQEPPAAPSSQASSQHVVTGIPLDSIDKNPYQTRAVFDEEML